MFWYNIIHIPYSGKFRVVQFSRMIASSWKLNPRNKLNCTVHHGRECARLQKLNPWNSKPWPSAKKEPHKNFPLYSSQYYNVIMHAHQHACFRGGGTLSLNLWAWMPLVLICMKIFSIMSTLFVSLMDELYGLILIDLQYLSSYTSITITVEPLNYGHHRTTLKCLQKGGVLYTESALGTLSSCRMPHVRKYSAP